MILLASPLMGQTVTQLEYFFDSDPGFGNGTSISVTEVDGEVNYEGSIITSSLSRGLHTLFIRAKNSDDEWGLTIKKLILVDQGEAREIEALEYFFDEDPGHGSGTAIPIAASAQIDKEAMLSTEGLSVGLHTIFIRAKFTDGNWGMPIKKLILIDQSDPVLVSNIISAEYFFNTDPGFASATAIPIETGTDIETTFTIPGANLPIGDQILYIRVQDSDGVWGQYASRAFDNLELPSLSFENSDTITVSGSINGLKMLEDISVEASSEFAIDGASVAISEGYIESEDSLTISEPLSFKISRSGDGLYLTGPGSIEGLETSLRSISMISKNDTTQTDTLKTIEVEVFRSDFSTGILSRYIEIQSDSMGTFDEVLENIPQEFALKQNYPNPFNPATNIEFAIPKNSDVSLIVYNLLGQQVTTLVDESISAGFHSTRFDASQLSSGVYIYRIQAGSFVQTKKMLLIK